MVNNVARHQPQSKLNHMEANFSIDDDAALVAGIAANEPRAARQVDAKYRKIVLFYFRKKMNYRHEEDAQDLCQETLAAAMTAAKNGRIANPEKLSDYVWGICRNKIKGWIEKKPRRPDSISEHENSVQANESLEDEIINRDLIDRALNLLSEEERQILKLRIVEGRDYDEIGRRLNPVQPVKADTVKKKYHRARGKIIQKLG